MKFSSRLNPVIEVGNFEARIRIFIYCFRASLSSYAWKVTTIAWSTLPTSFAFRILLIVCKESSQSFHYSCSPSTSQSWRDLTWV